MSVNLKTAIISLAFLLTLCGFYSIVGAEIKNSEIKTDSQVPMAAAKEYTGEMISLDIQNGDLKKVLNLFPIFQVKK